MKTNDVYTCIHLYIFVCFNYHGKTVHYFIKNSFSRLNINEVKLESALSEMPKGVLSIPLIVSWMVMIDHLSPRVGSTTHRFLGSTWREPGSPARVSLVFV